LALSSSPLIPVCVKTWQEHCTAVVIACMTLAPDQRAPEWAAARRKLISQANDYFDDVAYKRIVIADLFKPGADLSGFNFSQSYLIRGDLSGANLERTKFVQSIIRNVNCRDANVRDANFNLAFIANSDFGGVRDNRNTNWSLGGHSACTFDYEIEDRIRHAHAVRGAKRAPFLIRVINAIADHGYGIGRFSLSCLAIVVLFSALYWWLGPKQFAMATNADTLPLWTAFLFSVERFLNASPWISGVSPASHLLTTLESLLGVVALSLLIAMVTRKILRQ
jgi:hypothetical protein